MNEKIAGLDPRRAPERYEDVDGFARVFGGSFPGISTFIRERRATFLALVPDRYKTNPSSHKADA